MFIPSYPSSSTSRTPAGSCAPSRGCGVVSHTDVNAREIASQSISPTFSSSTHVPIFSSSSGRGVESSAPPSTLQPSTSPSALSTRSLHTGAAVGIGVGVGVATMLILSFLIFWLVRQKYQAIQQQLIAQNQQYQERLAQSMESDHAPSESPWIPPNIGWGYHQQPMDHNYQYQQGTAAPPMQTFYSPPESQPAPVAAVVVVPDTEWKDQKQHVTKHDNLSELDGTFSHTYEMQS